MTVTVKSEGRVQLIVTVDDCMIRAGYVQRHALFLCKSTMQSSNQSIKDKAQDAIKLRKKTGKPSLQVTPTTLGWRKHRPKKYKGTRAYTNEGVLLISVPWASETVGVGDTRSGARPYGYLPSHIVPPQPLPSTHFPSH